MKKLCDQNGPCDKQQKAFVNTGKYVTTDNKECLFCEQNLFTIYFSNSLEELSEQVDYYINNSIIN